MSLNLASSTSKPLDFEQLLCGVRITLATLPVKKLHKPCKRRGIPLHDTHQLPSNVKTSRQSNAIFDLSRAESEAFIRYTKKPDTQ